ncbi:MAG TPA: hypothetical protein VMJ32_16780 [Pirellulales bacterium]|nr:hypothetical protein [Pirellulales bacterium]
MTFPVILRGADDQSNKATDAKQTANAPATATAAPAAAAATDSTSATDDAKAKGRLPSGWGKLGITDAQKQSIYKVEASYETKIESLRKQLSDLETQRDADIRNLLTDAQHKQLDDAASAKSAKKAAAADAKNNAAAANANKTSMNDAK